MSAASGDLEALACDLALLINRPELRADMGGAGSEFVRCSLGKERLVANVAGFYRELVSSLGGAVAGAIAEGSSAYP